MQATWAALGQRAGETYASTPTLHLCALLFALCSYGYDMLFEYQKLWGQMNWLGVPFEQDPTGECARRYGARRWHMRSPHLQQRPCAVWLALQTSR